MKQLKYIEKSTHARSALDWAGDIWARHTIAIAGLLLLICAAMFFAPPVSAQSGTSSTARVFTVYGVEVDERARSATQARTQALRQAEVGAFQQLLRKIAPEDDLARLGEITPDTVRNMVLGVVVHNERTAPGRYLARLDITFSPEHVREMLGLADIPYSEVSGGPYILFAEFASAATSFVFDDNPWREALLAADMRNRMIQYVIPDQSFRDRLLLGGAKDQHSWQNTRNQRLEERFGTSTIFRTVAEIDDEGNLTMAWHDPSRADLNLNLDLELGQEADLAIGQISLNAKAGESQNELLKRGADIMLDRLDGLWKARTLTQFGSVNRFDASVVAHTAAEWADIRRRIKSLAIVRDVELRQLSVPVSYITILYAGGAEQLRLVMKNVDLELVEEYDGWRLQNKDPA